MQRILGFSLVFLLSCSFDVEIAELCPRSLLDGFTHRDARTQDGAPLVPSVDVTQHNPSR